MTAAWHRPAPLAIVHRRASGRRAYNSLRQDQASIRRIDICRYLVDNRLLLTNGMQTRLARRFGVSKSTISRDIREIHRLLEPCRRCGRYSSAIDDEAA